jgi:hypothetical protein
MVQVIANPVSKGGWQLMPNGAQPSDRRCALCVARVIAKG